MKYKIIEISRSKSELRRMIVVHWNNVAGVKRSKTIHQRRLNISFKFPSFTILETS